MKRFLLIIIAAVFTLSVVAAIIAFRTSSPQAVGQQTKPEITNLTMSLRVTLVDVTDKVITITVKNVGTKPIISYDIKYGGRGGGIVVGPSIDKGAWQPGETSEVKIGDFQRGGVVKLDLVNCIFEDLSSEGDWDSAQIQREQIEGQRVAYQVAEKYLAVLMQRDRADTSELRNVSAEIMQLPKPEGLTKWQQIGFDSGLSGLEGTIKTALQNIASAPDSEEMNKLQAEALKKSVSRMRRLGKSIELNQIQRRGGR